jgi:hypothetical protein
MRLGIRNHRFVRKLMLIPIPNKLGMLGLLAKNLRIC